MGTSGQGQVLTTRGALVKAFGEPHYEEISGDKTTIEWDLEFEDGTIATIYDYKREGGGYYAGDNGGELLDDFEEYEFYIGGHDKRAVDLVKEKLAEITELPKITERKKVVLALEYHLTFKIGEDEWTWVGYFNDSHTGDYWYLNGKPASQPEWAEDLDLYELADKE